MSQPPNQPRPPNLSLKWGPYFKPDIEDEVNIVTLTVQAKTAGIITDEMALRKVQDVFKIENIEEAVTELEKKREENAAAETDQLAAQHAAINKATGGAGGGSKPSAGKKPKPSK